jgi:hypothetical protein
MHGTQLASGIGTVLVILVLGLLGALEPLDTWWFDRLFELRGRRAPTTPIVIVTIDESSITEINRQWPFPRAVHADLIARISAGRPLAIGVDLLFDGPSAWGARDDEALGAAIMRAGTVVLSAAKTTPTIFSTRDFVKAGALMSYGPSYTERFRHAADYVDKILRGTKPGDIPVDQPTKFELVINLKTAKALGVTIPHSVLRRADEVIE